MTIWRMRIACWIPKAKNTDSEYLIHIQFPLQQWLHESTSMLSYTYTVCLSCVLLIFLNKRHACKCGVSTHYTHVNHRVFSDDHETSRWNTVAIILQ